MNTSMEGHRTNGWGEGEDLSLLTFLYHLKLFLKAGAYATL